MLGPAFVAGVAYVDPGNVATNAAAGSRFGYLLVWVILFSNLLAMLVQYLSAKLGIATGKSLPELCRHEYRRGASVAMWLQAEAVAVATDVAEILGGAVALNLLFGMPLLVGGVVTAAVSFLVLRLQRPGRQRAFETVIIFMLAVIAIGFLWSATASRPDPHQFANGLVPRLAGAESLVLAAGMLGATVMPHAIYLHSALIRDRFGAGNRSASRRRQLVRATRADVSGAMAVAGAVNLAMVVAAAAALHGEGIESLADVHAGLDQNLGAGVALLFAVALLVSGVASSSVGTYSGSVILEGFLQRRLSPTVRRAATIVPAMVILALGTDPMTALVGSQVVLSFGIPFALFPLMRFTQTKSLMHELVNKKMTTIVGYCAAIMVSGLNAFLIYLLLSSSD